MNELEEAMEARDLYLNIASEIIKIEQHGDEASLWRAVNENIIDCLGLDRADDEYYPLNPHDEDRTLKHVGDILERHKTEYESYLEINAGVRTATIKAGGDSYQVKGRASGHILLAALFKAKAGILEKQFPILKMMALKEKMEEAQQSMKHAMKVSQEVQNALDLLIAEMEVEDGED
ncbi:hypothetical protein [Pseudovibrio exalbescens]|uniref:hypothetical protein n=1 Tax=Pseudovibrio exalbescens TaxID=197461 RepID=UPI000C9A71A9|nr:hypothetical protein [Pseudovibrio exalbescens]